MQELESRKIPQPTIFVSDIERVPPGARLAKRRLSGTEGEAGSVSRTKVEGLRAAAPPETAVV